MLDKTERMVMLKDSYGPLLTEKQQNVLNLYYENDWSLSEIGESMGISRQGVHDLLRRAEMSLEDYEERLHLVDRFLSTRCCLNKMQMLLKSEMDANSRASHQIFAILKELDDLI